MLPDRTLATALLARACSGDELATTQLSPLLYEELRKIADHLLRNERVGHTLQPTALAHEAYLRLIDQARLVPGQDDAARARFLGIAARAMRRILVDHARGRATTKRRAQRADLSVEELPGALPTCQDTLLDLDAAIDRLHSVNPDLARIAELRLFGGLSTQELAPIVGLSFSSAKEHWALTRAWLSRLLAGAAAAD
jgi:RNA polymerase sigma-70 factor (ECF subfamily)